MSREHSTKYRRVVYKENKKRVNIGRVLLILALIVLVSSAIFFIYNYSLISSHISGTGKAVFEASNSVYNSIAKIIGLSIENAEPKEEEKEIIKEAEKENKQEEKAEKNEEKAKPEAEQPAEEETNETTEPTAEETIVPEENITEETNITIPEIITNKTIENITETNETLTNFTIENITEETNITIPEANITIINETLVNETEINITGINETITAENITALNITTRQYKAVINRRVKWIKTLKADKTEAGNLTLEIPKQATNITVRTGQEVQEALSKIENYEKIIEQADRQEIAETSIVEGIIGYVSLDMKESEGILTRLINWIKQLTITGKVIEENELQEEITEKQDKKEIDLTNIIEKAEEQEEIGVEYYTPAPISEEKIISRGKQVIISGPDELNYTDILAYSILDNKISINNSEKIKLYWIKEIEAEKTQKQTTDEITPAQEEITEEQNTEIINETEQPIDNSSAELDNFIDIENIIENETKDKEEKQGKNKTKEEITGQQTSPITAFAVKDKEKNNKDNETEQPINDSSAELDNLLDINNNNKIFSIREEVNFTAYDLDEDGNIDYIEWNVLHLSNQTYEIIYITKAEHLDENRIFISDIYEQVKALDGNWTLIPDGDYIRVTFEKPLDKTKDITIYARVKDACSASENEDNSIMINGTEVPCDIYQKKKRIDEIRMLGGS